MSYCIYLRKSRADAEAELRGEGETLARHEKILIELAAKLRLEVSAVYKELVSGENIASRPAMQNMLNEVGQGLWEGVIVMEIERLARGDTIDQGIVAQSFKFTNTKIITPTKIYNPNDEFDEEYFEFGLFMSRREYKTIRRRMTRGRESAVKEGKYIGTYPPYGYNKIWNGKDATLEINPEQADIVKLIYELYTKGEDKGLNKYKRLGYNAIAVKLNNMKVPPMRTDLWIASSVKAILKNPVYIGKLRWNYKKEVKKIINGEVKKTIMTNKKGDYILSNGLHQPIISEEIWNMAQDYTKQTMPSPAPVEFGIKNPFAGLVICGACGKKMHRKPFKNRRGDMLFCMTRDCITKSTYLDLFENQALESLKSWLDDYKIENGIKKEAVESDLQLSIKQKAMINLTKEIAVVKGQMDRLHNLLERGVYDAEVFLERSKTLKSKSAELESESAKLKSEIETIEGKEKNNKNIIPKIESLLKSYNEIESAEEKNKLLKEILNKIIYTREKRNYRGSADNKFEIKLFPKIT